MAAIEKAASSNGASTSSPLAAIDIRAHQHLAADLLQQGLDSPAAHGAVNARSSAAASLITISVLLEKLVDQGGTRNVLLSDLVAAAQHRNGLLQKLAPRPGAPVYFIHRDALRDVNGELVVSDPRDRVVVEKKPAMGTTEAPSTRKLDETESLLEALRVTRLAFSTGPESAAWWRSQFERPGQYFASTQAVRARVLNELYVAIERAYRDQVS